MSRRHFLAGYRIHSTPQASSSDLMARLVEFTTAVRDQIIDIADDNRVLKIERFQHNALTGQAHLRTGHYGAACPMVDRRTGNPAYNRRTNDADLMPLLLCCDMGAAPGPLAVFQKFGQLGVRTSFQQQWNNYLTVNAPAFRVEFKPVGPAGALHEWMRSGKIAQIRLHKRQTGTTRVGDLEIIQQQIREAANDGRQRQRRQQPPAVDRTLVIEPRWGGLRISDRIFGLGDDTLDPQALAEIVGEAGFAPESADLTIQVDQQRRMFRVGGDFRILENITDRLDFIDGEPTPESLLRESRNYLAALGRPLPQRRQ